MILKKHLSTQVQIRLMMPTRVPGLREPTDETRAVAIYTEVVIVYRLSSGCVSLYSNTSSRNEQFTRSIQNALL